MSTIDTNEPHYRLIEKDGKIIPVCVQWFDYFDYDSFVTERMFATEDEAKDVAFQLNRNGLGQDEIRYLLRLFTGKDHDE